MFCLEKQTQTYGFVGEPYNIPAMNEQFRNSSYRSHEKDFRMTFFEIMMKLYMRNRNHDKHLRLGNTVVQGKHYKDFRATPSNNYQICKAIIRSGKWWLGYWKVCVNYNCPRLNWHSGSLVTIPPTILNDIFKLHLSLWIKAWANGWLFMRN